MKMPAELYDFALTTVKNNKITNINLINNDNHSLKKIDDFTSNYTKDELYAYLINLHKIDDFDDKLKIVYKDKDEYKILSEGILYKEDKVDDMVLSIEEIIKNSKDNHILIRDIFKNIRVNRLIDDYIKKIFEVIYLNQHLSFDELKCLLDELYLFDKVYVDLRTSYMVIKNTYNKSLEKNKVKVLH